MTHDNLVGLDIKAADDLALDGAGYPKPKIEKGSVPGRGPKSL